jgi:hypothetical protein
MGWSAGHGNTRLPLDAWLSSSLFMSLNWRRHLLS